MNVETTLINLTIDGRAVSVPKGTTVYTAAKKMGIELPIFCYQDRLPPFGACRVCLVEVEKMGKLQTSCTLEATEGMVVKTQSAPAVEGRQGILEFLLINHPLDCPICDRGGECPLQDQAMKYGPGESRFFEDKRHFTKAKPLGPVLMLDRERCIVCARCTRFGDDIAGDHALEFIDRGYMTEVGTPGGRPVESKFIGNTIEICPVGALTSQVYRFKARPWDNRPIESTCTLCPVGCSLIFDARDGKIMRTRACENRDVNDIWLCDKGWFGYEFTDSTERLQKPLVRRHGKLEPAGWDEALSLIIEKINQAKPQGKLAGFGGEPLTVEENFLFQKLMRDGLGVNHVDHRIGTPIIGLDEEGLAAGMEMSIGECEELSYAMLLGIDLTEEFPVIWLRLKQAINRGAKVIFVGHLAPEIAPHLSKTVLHTPGEELATLNQQLPHIASLAAEGKKGAIFVGRQYLDTPQRLEIIAQLLTFQQDTPQLALNIMEGCGNSVGARLAGMRPDLGPLGERLDEPGLDAIQVLERCAESGWDFLHVAGADPATQFPAKLWGAARAKLGFLVVQDLFLTETARQADVVLPTLSYAEKGGSFVNIEGRVQKLQPGKDLPYGIYSDAEIFTLLALRLNFVLTLDTGFIATLQQDRLSLTRPKKLKTAAYQTAAVDPNGSSLSATFTRVLFDQGVRMRHNPHVSQLAKEPRVRLHPREGQNRGLQDGATVHLSANGNTISAQIKWDERIAAGTLALPLGFAELPVHDLGTNLLNGLMIEIKNGTAAF